MLYMYNHVYLVVDPGFDLVGGVDFVNGRRWGGYKIIESVDRWNKSQQTTLVFVLYMYNHVYLASY